MIRPSTKHHSITDQDDDLVFSKIDGMGSMGLSASLEYLSRHCSWHSVEGHGGST